MICAACGRRRPLTELLAFWPVGNPDRRRHVCRPSVPQLDPAPCFRAVVGSQRIHAIGPAT